jgi:hypothetical protein
LVSYGLRGWCADYRCISDCFGRRGKTMGVKSYSWFTEQKEDGVCRDWWCYLKNYPQYVFLFLQVFEISLCTCRSDRTDGPFDYRFCAGRRYFLHEWVSLFDESIDVNALP